MQEIKNKSLIQFGSQAEIDNRQRKKKKKNKNSDDVDAANANASGWQIMIY